MCEDCFFLILNGIKADPYAQREYIHLLPENQNQNDRDMDVEKTDGMGEEEMDDEQTTRDRVGDEPRHFCLRILCTSVYVENVSSSYMDVAWNNYSCCFWK